MMIPDKKVWLLLSLSICVLTLLPLGAWAQNASLSGSVTDPSGAVVPDAEVTLSAIETNFVAKLTTNPDGLYSFPNLQPGKYELKVTAKGFRDFIQRGIWLLLDQKGRLDVAMVLGAESQVLEVQSDASAINYDTSEVKGSISPDTVRELPLLVSGGARSAGLFMTLLPGVTTPTGTMKTGDPTGNYQINGGVKFGGEGLIDGITVATNGISGLFEASYDFLQSPDMVNELKVITSNYEAQYGTGGGSGVMIMETKSGTNQFHGAVYEYHRNTALNARQFGVAERPQDLENDFGWNIGGPAKLPGLWSGKHKTYFYFNFERFRQRGALTVPTLSVPSLKERAGDFTDWVDANGNLIPIFDPATTRIVNGEVVRDQFMGCEGKTPNVICPDRIQNSLAKGWFKFLPEPTSPGPLSNYVPPHGVRDFNNPDSNFYTLRVDEYLGNNDHLFFSLYKKRAPLIADTLLPPQISTNYASEITNWLLRVNWDHTFGPTLINHFAAGYNDHQQFQGSVAASYADQLPQIAGVPSHAYPPSIGFSSGFTSLGNFYGFGENNKNVTPTIISNDLLSWVKGKHTFKFGGEFRYVSDGYTNSTGEAGSFFFDTSQTGLLGINSGNPIASFLLEQVNSGSVSLWPYGQELGVQHVWLAHAGDTWKVTPKLSLTWGLRWEMHTPSVEKHDVLSFFDPQGPNPGAGGRPGRLTFAGTRWGEASFGKQRPEETFTKAFGPRVGIAYSPHPKMVVRAGYGIFYETAQYPGWTQGIGTDGFNGGAAFGPTLGGLAPAFILSAGFPQNFQRPPFIDPAYDNGRSAPIYRPFDANRLPYAQQWNLTIERELKKDLTVSAAYVGSKGTRLNSALVPINALDPRLLQKYGSQLYDEFAPGQTSLHGVPVPYDGWVEQMTGCAPSLAQALRPFPQYCDGITGNNENAGNSTYHSLQVKAEKRFSSGIWFLGSYTLSKLLNDTDNAQPEVATFVSQGGVISPFERQRNKSLSVGDIPQSLTLSLIYDLPFGKGKRWLTQGTVVDKIVGGWRLSSVFRANSGYPFYFRSSQCNVPGAFNVACIPGILPGADPWAQSKGNFDPSKPLFNPAAFEPVNNFNFYYGVGPRISNLRGFGYYNHDLAIMKNIQIKETVTLQLRGEFFNVWNWHIFTSNPNNGGSFNNDVASPDFGLWNGGVSDPRNIQVGARITF